jgi:hypothetical protein
MREGVSGGRGGDPRLARTEASSRSLDRRSAVLKRKKIAALLVASAFALTVAAPASADKPKFNPNDNACQGPNDQKNCPGGPH